MQRRRLPDTTFTRGFRVSTPPTSAAREGALCEGSRNQLFLGEGVYENWRGLAAQAVNSGARIMTQMGNTYGGLRDNGATQAFGSAFQDAAGLIAFIGAGQVTRDGAPVTGAIAQNLLQFLLRANGVYTDALSGPYIVGLPQPSAPDVAIAEGTAGRLNASVSFKIARESSLGLGRSNASLTSVVIAPGLRKIRLTFPTVATGQTHWAIFAPQEGFGGAGVHRRLAYNNQLSIPESVIAAGVVDGIPRSLLIDYVPSDLTTEEAWTDDFPPPSGTHACRLENVMLVGGCFPDAVNAPDPSNPGTVIAVSLPNTYTSFKPKHWLYLPERIVSVLARPSDSYAYFACENSIHAVQYIGPQPDGPAAALTTIWPTVGIKYPHNWCQVNGLLYAFISDGSIVRMTPDGDIDYEWAAPIKPFIKNWLPQDTVISVDFASQCVVLFNRGAALPFCLSNGEWSAPCYLADANIAGDVVAATPSNGKLYLSVFNAGATRAYRWHEGAASMLVAQFGPFRELGERAGALYEPLATFEAYADRLTPCFFGIHRNLRLTHVTDGAVTATQNIMSSAAGKFSPDLAGSLCAVFGGNIGGAGVHYLWGRIGYISPTQISLTNVSTGAALNAQATAANLFAVIGADIIPYSPTLNGWQDLPPAQCAVQGARNYAYSLTTIAGAGNAQLFSMGCFGTGLAQAEVAA